MKNKKICLLLSSAMLALSLTACGGNEKDNNMNDMVSSESDYTTNTSSATDEGSLMNGSTNTPNSNSIHGGLNNNSATGSDNSTVDHSNHDDFNNSVTEGSEDIQGANDNDSLGEDIMDGVDNMMDDARQGVRNIADSITR